MSKVSNDATLSKLGDIYQYYIALLECFKMKENEKILIEVYGDVSKISKNSSIQLEIKHHIGDDLIGDRDNDFWKTLKNWVIEFSRIKEFNKLILFTTSDIANNSLLINWNEQNSVEKLKTLKNIGSVIKVKEKSFRTFYNDIFVCKDYDEKVIIDILSKFEIVSKQKQVARIDQDFSTHIKYIPETNREKFISALLGLIVAEVKEEPHYWEITYKDFERILQETAPLYTSPVAPLPTEYAELSPSKEIEMSHQDKDFVRAILRIQYDDEIPRAIRDYWRTNMTIVKYYSNNPVFNKSLSNYKENLKSKLHYTKEPIKIDYENAERFIQIKESKKLYSCIMAWDATAFESVNPNQPFFQKGIIHDIVDGGDFTWDVGDKNEY